MMIATLQYFFSYILHIDNYLITFVATYGIWTYAILFSLIFCETGLIILPFLPGDSLLFAAGSIAAHEESALNIQLLFVLLLIASILGNKLNYLVGRMAGTRLFVNEQSWLFNKKYLDDTHRFYAKHGGKTIIMARFLPIVRTFAPFVAGMSRMGWQRFSFYNVLSAILWIGSLLGAGYFLGSIPFIQQHFSLVVYAIVGFSLLPPLITLCYKKYRH